MFAGHFIGKVGFELVEPKIALGFVAAVTFDAVGGEDGVDLVVKLPGVRGCNRIFGGAANERAGEKGTRNRDAQNGASARDKKRHARSTLEDVVGGSWGPCFPPSPWSLHDSVCSSTYYLILTAEETVVRFKSGGVTRAVMMPSTDRNHGSQAIAT